MNTKYKFLLEKPSESDEFTGGSHQRIANSVYETLANDNQINVIGIEGELGSGKSTVIELIKNKGMQEGFDFISFDVERFQHGATKKALIETIYISIESGLDVDSIAKAKKAKAVALGNHVEYSSNVESHINGWVVAFVISLIFAASVFKESLFGVSYFLKFIFYKFGLLGDGEIAFSVDYSAIAALIVTIIPGIIYLFSLKQLTFLGAKPPQTGDLFKKNSYDRVSESFDIAREVGAYELQEALTTFVSLIEDNKKYILVIDNIDRVTDDKLREVWSDIDVFKTIAHDKIQLLIPYSHSHVAKALCLTESSVGEGREFISKRLPITFRVSPIVTADWKTHFAKMINEAINSISEQNTLLATRLVESLAPVSKTQITPRYLKRLINSVVCVMRINLDGISVISALFYQLSIVELNVEIEFLLNTKKLFIDSSNKGEDSLEVRLVKAVDVIEQIASYEDWSKDLISIHFQAPYKVIESEFLIKPLRSALEEKNPIPFLNKQNIFGYSHIISGLIIEFGTENLVCISAKMLELEELDYNYAWVKHWWPSIDRATCSDYRKINNITSLIESYKVIISHGFEFDKDRLKREFDRLESISSDRNANLILPSDIAVLYNISEIIKLKPDFVDEGNLDFYYELLWPNREKFTFWDLEDRALHSDEVYNFMKNNAHNNLDVFFLEKILDCNKLGWNDVDDEDLTFQAKAISQIDFIGDKPEHLNSIIFSQEWRDSSTMGFYISQHLKLEGFIKDRVLAQAVAHIVLTKDYSRFAELEQYIDINEGYIEHLASVLALRCLFYHLLEVLKQPELFEYVKDAIALLILKDRVHRINIGSCISQFPVLMKLSLSPVSILKWLEAWISEEYEISPESLINISSVIFHTAFSHEDLENWQIAFIQTLSRQKDTAWWTSQLLEPSDNVRYIFETWFRDRKKIFIGSQQLTNSIKNLFVEENVNIISKIDDYAWFDTLLFSLKKTSRNNVIQHLSKTMHEYRTGKDTQLAIFRIFNRHIKVLCDHTSQSQEIALMLFEHFPQEFVNRDLNLGAWSDANLKQLKQLQSDKNLK